MKEITKSISFKCMKCGNCCKAGLEISLRKEDISRWIDSGKEDFLQHIQIDSKSISSEGLAGYHIEDKNALLDILHKYGKEFYESKKKELKEFILNNHYFLGSGIFPLPIYSFIPELGRMPILTPHGYNVIFIGMDWNLEYIIKFNDKGACPFLKKKKCSIHDIKPIDCRQFPYDKKGHIKDDKFFFKICKGIKILE